MSGLLGIEIPSLRRINVFSGKDLCWRERGGSSSKDISDRDRRDTGGIRKPLYKMRGSVSSPAFYSWNSFPGSCGRFAQVNVFVTLETVFLAIVG